MAMITDWIVYLIGHTPVMLIAIIVVVGILYKEFKKD